MGQIPSEGLRFHAALNEGSGGTIHLTVDGKPLTAALASGAAWDAGHIADKAFKVQSGGTLEVADAGDFDNRPGFSYGAWVKLTKNVAGGAVFARMDAPVGAPDGVATGYLTMGRLEIPRCDNDPNHLDLGIFVLHMEGGK